MDLSDTPYEILSNIIGNLSPREIIRLCGLNRTFNQICNDYHFWAYLGERNISFPIDDFKAEGVNPVKRYFDIDANVSSTIDDLVSAVSKDDLYNMDIILHYVDPSINDNQLIKLAVLRYGLRAINRLLEDPRIDPSATDNIAIILAAERGKLDIVNRLLEDPRVDPSSDNNMAIILAAKYGHIDVVNRLLKDPRVDPSARNNRALEWAMINDHLHVVNRLLDDPRVDPRVDRGVNNILSIAATRGNIDIVNRLLEDPRFDPTFNNNIAIRDAIVCDRIDVARRLYYDPRANVPEFRDYIEQYRAMD